MPLGAASWLVIVYPAGTGRATPTHVFPPSSECTRSPFFEYPQPSVAETKWRSLGAVESFEVSTRGDQVTPPSVVPYSHQTPELLTSRTQPWSASTMSNSYV